MSALQGHDVLSPSKFAITQFSYEEFIEFWPQMLERMNKIRHMWPQWDEEFILTAMANRHLTLWGCGSPPNAEFVFFTQVFTYPSKKVLCVPLAFGTFTSAMMPLMDATMEQYARGQGCTEIEIRGRRGWKPHFEKIGFQHKFDIWTRPVVNMRNN